MDKVQLIFKTAISPYRTVENGETGVRQEKPALLLTVCYFPSFCLYVYYLYILIKCCNHLKTLHILNSLVIFCSLVCSRKKKKSKSKSTLCSADRQKCHCQIPHCRSLSGRVLLKKAGRHLNVHSCFRFQSH